MAGFHDKNSRVVGTWKIIECVSLSGSSEATGIEGTEFVLSEAGDVTWRVTDGCDALPLFSCQMYEVYTYQNLQCYGNRTLLRFAAYNGHIIEFRLDQPVMSRDLMLLTYDGWFMLQCEKLNMPEVAPDLSYSLLPALSDGYFSDITIISKSGRKVEVHSIVLESSMPGLAWESLCGLEDAALDTILHYLYCCCLPSSLTLDTAAATITATHRLLGFDELRGKCEIFVRNTTLRNRLVSLMGEVQQCVKAMVQIFTPTDPAVTSPSHLITMLKAALRQMAIGVVKVVEVSREFEHCGRWLTQAEQHEVMRYTRSRLPFLLEAVISLLRNMRTSLAALNHHTRQQLAQQLVPEISSVLQTVCVDVGSLRTSLEHIIQASLEAAHSPTHLLAKSLRNDLHLRELQKLRILQENLTSFLNSLVHKREQFEEMGGSARVRGVARIIEHFTEELTVLTFRLEEVAMALDETLEWSEFKFVFKGATSKVGSIVDRLVEHRGVVESLVLELVERVAHPAFSTSLHHLGLLPPSQHPSTTESPSPDLPRPQEFRPSSADLCSPGDCEAFGDTSSRSNSTTSSSDNPPSSASSTTTPRLHHRSSQPEMEEPLREEQTNIYGKLSLVQRVCEPPLSRSSPLALNIARLLADPVLSDMTFVVVPPADDETSPSSSQEELDTLEGHDNSQNISKDTRIHGTNEFCDPTSQQGARVTSTVVRKVKKSLSLDRPSVRVPMPTQAYSLDCDAMTCLNTMTILPCDIKQLGADVKVTRQTRESERPNSGEAKFTAVNCDDNLKLNDDNVSFSDSENTKHKTLTTPETGRHKVDGVALQWDCDKNDSVVELCCSLRHSTTLSKTDTQGNSNVEGTCDCNNSDNRFVNLLDFVDQDDLLNMGDETGELRNMKGDVIATTRQGSEIKDTKAASHRSKQCIETHPKTHSGDVESAEMDSTLKTNSTSSPESDKVTKPIEEKEKKGRLTKTPNIVIDDSAVGTKHCSNMEKNRSLEQRTQCSWEGVELQAHRVVVAARCEWFRRALLSGMREAIDRCIVVHGCSVQTFQLLMQFLYSGHVECGSLPPDQLVDLLVLADHYGVDALKLMVESGLEQHVDDESVVPLLTVAHHCNAAHLKDVCIQHCVVSAALFEGETLTQLPDDLREHLTQALGKHRKWMGAIGQEVLVGGEGMGGEDSPLSVSSTDPLIDDSSSLTPSLQYGVGEESGVEGSEGNGGSGNLRLESVVRHLREIVGPQVPRSTLVEITLAADYDLNRALNFFYK
ncbi:hypothetical protein Pmani_005804 [Petrolisthes manimaculis]|uniref:BTB domain-containing protein n=1 Tax=Petrolisthes manimaculis TaxID=1843537 RepID=A0AAE1QBH6_9EUCA|nr:hypothetical protein Pmani_005804 [Petrolisthes manimaculis]